jgi:hydroxymethylbilane synthase
VAGSLNPLRGSSVFALPAIAYRPQPSFCLLVIGSKIVVATRKSPLALAQTDMVIAHLRRHLPEKEFSLLKLVTTGDRQRDWSLEKEGGKGLFTSELEQALLRGDADVAMHSTKDLPTEMGPGLALAGFLPRDDARDLLVLRDGMESPTVLASGSPRRRAQAARMFPEAEWKEIRGNVETRLRKIADGEADGTLLAAAGLHRLGIEIWPGLTFRVLETREMVPAVGQGAIAVQCRSEDADALAEFFDPETRLAVTVERTFLGKLGGGCHTAFAAHFSEGVLEIFHEATGYRHYCLPNLSLNEVELALEPIVEDISA